MASFSYTQQWIYGEITEGFAVMAGGAFVLICAGLFWKYAFNSHAKAVILPFTVFALVLIASSIVMVLNNYQRLDKFQLAQEQDKIQFIYTEKKRVEGFMTWYRYTYMGASIAIILALVIFTAWAEPVPRAWSFVLLMLGFAALMIDYFSEHRAIIYQSQLVKLINSIEEESESTDENSEVGEGKQPTVLL